MAEAKGKGEVSSGGNGGVPTTKTTRHLNFAEKKQKPQHLEEYGVSVLFVLTCNSTALSNLPAYHHWLGSHERTRA